MAKKNVRIVQPRPDKKWEGRKPGAKRASVVANTKREAEKRTREMLRKDGGGELQIRDERGRIADSDTVPKGHDPFPPKDTK